VTDQTASTNATTTTVTAAHTNAVVATDEAPERSTRRSSLRTHAVENPVVQAM
jgi:hypothetical protein